jgi:hypothetical protein
MKAYMIDSKGILALVASYVNTHDMLNNSNVSVPDHNQALRESAIKSLELTIPSDEGEIYVVPHYILDLIIHTLNTTYLKLTTTGQLLDPEQHFELLELLFKRYVDSDPRILKVLQ